MTADGDFSHEIKRRLLLGRKTMIPRQHIKKNRGITWPKKKVFLVKTLIFSRSHAWMEELDYKDSWGPNKYCFWTVVLETILERPLECKKIKPVNPKGNKSWIFIWRTHAEAETLILWPYDVKKWLIGKDPDAGKVWRQEEKGMTEDDMAGWHHWLDGHEVEQALGIGDGQGSLACCSPCGRKESDTIERLKWTEVNIIYAVKKTFLPFLLVVLL